MSNDNVFELPKRKDISTPKTWQECLDDTIKELKSSNNLELEVENYCTFGINSDGTIHIFYGNTEYYTLIGTIEHVKKIILES